MTAAYTEFPVQTRLVRALTGPMRLTLHGMPEGERVEQLEHWRGHLSFLHADRGPIDVLTGFTRSTLAHVGWRITSGPPSALLPGAALLLAGIATAVLAVVSASFALPNVVVSVAALFLGSVLVRHPRVQPRRTLSAATLIAAITCLLYSIAIATDIWVPADWFIVAGTGLISLGMALVSLGASPLRLLDVQTGRAWGFGLCAVGAGSVAVAELDWLLRGTDLSVMIGRGLAAVAMLVVAFTAWRIREVPQEPEAPHRITIIEPKWATKPS